MKKDFFLYSVEIKWVNLTATEICRILPVLNIVCCHLTIEIYYKTITCTNIMVVINFRLRCILGYTSYTRNRILLQFSQNEGSWFHRSKSQSSTRMQRCVNNCLFNLKTCSCLRNFHVQIKPNVHRDTPYNPQAIWRYAERKKRFLVIEL